MVFKHQKFINRINKEKLVSSDTSTDNGDKTSDTVCDTTNFGTMLPTINQVVKSLINEALSESSGNQNAAAKLLGISQALSRQLKNSSNKAFIVNGIKQVYYSTH